MRVLVSPFSNVTVTSVRSKYDRGHVPLFPTFKGCQCSGDTRINILCTHGCNVFSTLLYVYTVCLFLTMFATTMAAEAGGRAVVLELIKMGVRRFGEVRTSELECSICHWQQVLKLLQVMR